MRCSGDLSSIECTVRSKTDHASLWKHTITDVWGRLSKYLPGFLHLKYRNNDVSLYYISIDIHYIHLCDMLLLSWAKRIIILYGCLYITCIPVGLRLFHSNHVSPIVTNPALAPYSCFCLANGSQSNEYQLHVHRTDVASLTDALGHGFSPLYYIFLIHTHTHTHTARPHIIK
jgi:hypothetical protein